MSAPQAFPHLRAAVRTQKATEAIQQHAADRAADDPKKVDKADRIIRTAITRGRMDASDYIARLVDELPPLNEADRAKLAALLTGGGPE